MCRLCSGATMAALDTLIARLGVTFADPGLLQRALTHSSYLNERIEERLHLASNERLEFLGDAVVNYLAATLVYQRFPSAGEGELTAWRTALVRTEMLAGLARRYDLGTYVLLARGEELSGARRRPSLLADTFEAVVAAMYLDGGLDAVRAFLSPLFEAELTQLQTYGPPVDYKSALQSRIQAERGVTPRYRTLEVIGPEHQREFTVEALAGEESLGVGRGPSKQAAAQAAARAALEALNVERGNVER